MLLQKTAKALEELQPGRRSLPLRERSVLLMADGRTEEQLQQVLGAQAGELIEQLIASGHLQRLAGQAAESSPPAHAPTPSMAPAAAKESSPPGPAATLNLAGTRMYLFDMCERMFANRHEDKAQVLRHLLREARDLEALQAAALQLLQTVQEHAGDERADALRERLRHLLPKEAATAQGA
ncbi:hypothetical protein CHL79_03450 [Delftia acidovorans]|uniref:hypothetical protein n=1 Tax=Delftia acidovorans TaxID=80866 RepID=UPI000BC31B7C|nr:hypothetical protein [Delftia acidovorans]ATH11546.1 hypothetical protein CHL79_03450 [Delftia acidovorans]